MLREEHDRHSRDSSFHPYGSCRHGQRIDGEHIDGNDALMHLLLYRELIARCQSGI